MSAYNRGELSVEAYLVRIIAALCRQNGGELRVKGELVDTIGEATALLKSWDSKTQELILSVSMGTFGEVFRVVPEKQNAKQLTFVDQATRDAEPLIEKQPSRHGDTLDNPNLSELEKKKNLRIVVGMLKDELRKRKQNQTGE